MRLAFCETLSSIGANLNVDYLFDEFPCLANYVMMEKLANWKENWITTQALWIKVFK